MLEFVFDILRPGHGLGNFSPQQCRLHGLTKDGIYYVRLTLVDPDRVEAHNTGEMDAAAESVRELAQSRPEVLATGHGLPMRGPGVASGLQYLADHFDPPRRGRYVHEPARADESGTTYVPPAPNDRFEGAPLLSGALLLSIAVNRPFR